MKEATFKKWPLVSWEPEIFISGGLILTLVNIQPFLNQLKFLLQPFQSPGTKVVLLILSSAIGSLTVGFVLHLVLRALWLMKMGIASGFERPLMPSSFRFKGVYSKRLDNIDVHDSAIKLGKLSSLVFSASFFFLLLSMGFAVLSTVLVGALMFFEIGDYALPFVLGLFFLLLIDFISLGYVKRTRLGVFLYPVFTVLYFLSLSFLYRDVYYHLVQNVKWKILILGFIIFVTSSVLLGLTNISEAMRFDTVVLDNRYDKYNPNIYDDERKAYSRSNARISSYFQSKDVMKFFLYGHYDLLENALDNDGLQVKIEGNVVPIFRILNHTTSENQFGYLGFLDISHVLPRSEHLMEVLLDNKLLIEIPFYKE